MTIAQLYHEGYFSHGRERLLKAERRGELIENHFTPLTLAAHFADPELVPLLLSAGADPNKPDFRGGLPLTSHLGDKQSVAILLRAGASPNGPEHHDGLLPLNAAVRGRRYDVVALLMKAKADPHRITPGERTSALGIAERSGDERMISLLKNATP